jgi:hypothetical protein
MEKVLHSNSNFLLIYVGEQFFMYFGQVMIEKVVDRWSGSLEAGVTAIHPEDIEFPTTMTDIDYDTWMLSGSSVMMNGACLCGNIWCVPLWYDVVRATVAIFGACHIFMA